MQQFLYIILFSALIAGCNDNSATTPNESRKIRTKKSANGLQLNAGEAYFDSTGAANADTLGMAEFLALKAARFRQSDRVEANNSKNKANNSIYKNEVNVDTLGSAEYKRTREKTERQPIEVPSRHQEITTASKKPYNSRNSTTSKKQAPERQSMSNAENNSPNDSAVAAVPAEQTKEKKEVNRHVSNKTKGAIIGAVTGAAAGAAINKRNRKAGGVVGGILGAATGYGIGRHKDKKDTAAKGGKQTPDNKQQF